jgi:hypothetical protein
MAEVRAAMPRPMTWSPLIFPRFEILGAAAKVGRKQPRLRTIKAPEPLVIIHASYVLTCTHAWPREISMKRAMIIVKLWWLAC